MIITKRKYKPTIPLLFIFLSFVACSENSSEEIAPSEYDDLIIPKNLSWDVVKNLDNFSMFFTFAMETKNDSLLNICIDSLNYNLPASNNYELHIFPSYSPSGTKSFISCDLHEVSGIHCCDWNCFITMELPRDKPLRTTYIGKRIESYSRFINEVYLSDSVSENFPPYMKVEWNETTIKKRRFFVRLDCEFQKNRNTSKFYWKKVLVQINELLKQFTKIKETISMQLYHVPYPLLDIEKRRVVDERSKYYFTIKFYDLVPCPPPIQPNKSILE